jgi:hypothetical protein
MVHRLFRAGRGVCAALAVLAAVLGSTLPSAFAEDAKTGDKPAGQEPAKDTQKVDEYTEAQHEIAGPAGNPECVWLGRRVVGLLLRDDLDTAFRHLDMYDRFGCPSAHIQASFRCIILHQGSINSKAADPNAADSLNGRVQACWINPANPAPPPAPAAPPAAAANPSNSH